jgi:transposase-like protein
MRRIVASIAPLEHHVKAVHETPGVYRPSSCPHCGIKEVWQHGFYYRKADRRTQSKESLNPVPIRRYCCSVCRHTCSRLPLCIAPRRWSDWTVQQSVLIQLLNGFSRRECARGAAPSRHTVARWWDWLQARTAHFEFHLRARDPEFGRVAGFTAFWAGVFESLGLARAMAILDQAMIVP